MFDATLSGTRCAVLCYTVLLPQLCYSLSCATLFSPCSPFPPTPVFPSSPICSITSPSSLTSSLPHPLLFSLSPLLRSSQFVLPECPRCGTGILKPDVVFFGDSVPKDRVLDAFAMVSQGNACVCLSGCASLFVYVSVCICVWVRSCAYLFARSFLCMCKFVCVCAILVSMLTSRSVYQFLTTCLSVCMYVCMPVCQ
jgi:Sir2 family